MNVLIIYAHPNPHSFNHAILEQLTRGFRDGAHFVTVLNLYEEQFDPVLVFDDQRKRRDLAHLPETRRYRELVREADHLVFVYPIWWYGPPGILKGFLDKVFVSGFAYTYEGRLPRGLLTGKSAWVVYTIDSPGWFVRWFRHSAEWTVMRDAVLRFCGIRRVKRMMFTSASRSSPKRRQQWLDRLYQKARNFGG